MINIDLRRPETVGHWRDNPIGAFFELARKAPGEVARLHFPLDRITIIQDAVKARHILRENGANYNKNFGGFSEFFGISRITADGPQWEKLHRLSQPYINSSRPQTVTDAVNENFGSAIAAMLAGRDKAGGLVLDQALSRAAAGVVSDAALGFDHLAVDDDLIDDFRTILDLGSVITWNFGGALPASTREKQELAVAARARLAERFEEAVARTNAHSEGATLLRDLADARDEGVDIIAELCTLLFAGFDTSASALGWGLFLLATMPDLQKFLRQRIREECGSGPITVAALDRLADVVAFQNEALRIFPPIPILGRIAIEPDSIDGLELQKGERVMISIIGLHHDSRFFEGPTQVRLRRYTDGQLEPHLATHLMPFGAGRRMCGGARLANIELTAALALLIRELEFNLPDQRPLEFTWSASLRRKGGQYLLVRPAPKPSDSARSPEA